MKTKYSKNGGKRLNEGCCQKFRCNKQALKILNLPNLQFIPQNLQFNRNFFDTFIY